MLNQANLVPLSYLIQPIYWDYSEALNLNSTPDFLVLADTAVNYSLDNFEEMGVSVLNPGNFSCKKTFSIIYPHLGTTEECNL